MFCDYVVNSEGLIEWEENDVEENSLENETVPVSESASDSPVLSGESETAPSLAVQDGDLIFTDDGPVRIMAADGLGVLAAGDPLSADSMVVFNVTVSGFGQCKFVVTPDQADLLEVTNGTIINWSSSNVTGALFQGEITHRDAVDTLMLTLLGRGSSNYASNYYRYGSEQYVTYYEITNAYLSTEQRYVTLSEASQESWSVSFWFSLIVVVCLLLLAVNAVIRFLRRGFRG